MDSHRVRLLLPTNQLHYALDLNRSEHAHHPYQVPLADLQIISLFRKLLKLCHDLSEVSITQMNETLEGFLRVLMRLLDSHAYTLLLFKLNLKIQI